MKMRRLDKLYDQILGALSIQLLRWALPVLLLILFYRLSANDEAKIFLVIYVFVSIAIFFGILIFRIAYDQKTIASLGYAFAQECGGMIFLIMSKDKTYHILIIFMMILFGTMYLIFQVDHMNDGSESRNWDTSGSAGASGSSESDAGGCGGGGGCGGCGG